VFIRKGEEEKDASDLEQAFYLLDYIPLTPKTPSQAHIPTAIGLSVPSPPSASGSGRRLGKELVEAFLQAGQAAQKLSVSIHA
jgi:hypothetical protein